MTQGTSIEQELDTRHDAAQAAFARRDIDAYAAIFRHLSPTGSQMAASSAASG